MPLSLSIIVPTKNRPEDLYLALSSIIPHMDLWDELIIIDQSDKPFISHIFKSGKCCVKYMHCPWIGGLVEAKNYALEFVHNDIVLFLEDDIELCSDYLSNVRKAFSDPSLIAGCGTEINPKISSFYRFLFKLSHVGPFSDPRVNCYCDPDSSNNFVRSRYLSGGISFFRREVFDKVKFDLKNDFFALEDIDFSTRVSSAFPTMKMGIFLNICLYHHRSAVNRAKFYELWSRKLNEYFMFYLKQTFSYLTFVAFVWLLTCLFFHSLISSFSSRNLGPIRGYISGLLKGIKHSVS